MIAGKGAEVFKRPRLQPGLQGPGLEFGHFTLSVPVARLASPQAGELTLPGLWLPYLVEV